MFIVSLCMVGLMNALSIGVARASEEPNPSTTWPTAPPGLPSTGLFKFVQSCESFCDNQFPPGALEGEPLKAVVGCHKGCYSFEIFKGMSRKHVSFSILEKFCSANCRKDFKDEDFAQQFCTLGCSRMTVLYRAGVKEIRQDIEKSQEKEEIEMDSDNPNKLEQEAERKIMEPQNMVADELAVAAFLEYEKKHGARAVNTGPHRRRFKTRIVHVERILENSELRPYAEMIPRNDTEPYDGSLQKRDREMMKSEEIAEEGERQGATVIEFPPFSGLHCSEKTCFMIFVATVLGLCLFFTICITICWVRRYEDYFFRPSVPDFYLGLRDLNGGLEPRRDPDPCCFGSRFWRLWGKEEVVVDKPEETDYMSPPPEKDAPPPYEEIVEEEVYICNPH